ncbi:MAG: hypothetical protein JSV27_10225 [Candidatus Bathyarchaeota archaeon]|nr:MAG: hypothetical protein JSV27_10225 [Candidatus Bathyarchaeota archaeon]
MRKIIASISGVYTARTAGGRGTIILIVSTLLIPGLLALVEYRNFTK